MIAFATEMALVHNLLIRGLNAIYLQAPHVQASDERAFLNHAWCWYTNVHVHHSGEESYLFPLLEDMAGIKGVMDVNVEQHHLFEGGVQIMSQYIRNCLDGKEAYDGKKLVSLIDDFGHILAGHLADEIPTLLGLQQFGDRMNGLAKRSNEGGQANMASPAVPFCAVPI